MASALGVAPVVEKAAQPYEVAGAVLERPQESYAVLEVDGRHGLVAGSEAVGLLPLAEDASAAPREIGSGAGP